MNGEEIISQRGFVGNTFFISHTFLMMKTTLLIFFYLHKYYMRFSHILFIFSFYLEPCGSFLNDSRAFRFKLFLRNF